MVLFRGSSAPPPYKETDAEAPPPILSTVTTTTEVRVTTTSTTHFFSLPLWARKIKPTTSTTSLDNDTAAAGTRDGSDMSIREKDLPHLPPDSRSESMESHGENSQTADAIFTEDMRISTSSFLGPDPRGFEEPAKNHALQHFVHASLGIGLPHGVGAVSPSGGHVLRGVRSTQKLRAMSTFAASEEPEYTRARGLSMGAGAALTSFTPNDAKGKGKAPDPPVLSRRSSFWSRKKSRPSTPIVDIPLPEPTSLPVLPPISPFVPNHPDVSPPSSTPSSGGHTRGLSRSRSERVPLRSSMRASELPPPPRSSSGSVQQTLSVIPPVPLEQQSFISLNSQPFPSTPIYAPATPYPPLPPPAPHILHTQSHRLPGEVQRPRSQTNPPLLLRRLSATFFSSSPQSNMPMRTSISSFSGLTSPNTPNPNSPRPSLSKPTVHIPKPKVDQESPEIYLGRLLEAVSKAEVAGVLASSNDPFHVRALRVYIEQFNFVADPLDVALRKLLMDVGLPRETQQIDRVMEAFAIRYLQCNPNLFISDDHPYILAFSLIMLHTDAFNKSNKRKMSKVEYVKNTRLPGVASEILDCFYDNIVFAPFIFVEDPLDVNGQRGLVFRSSSNRAASTSSWNQPSSATSPGANVINKGGKVDPYYLIAHNLLDPLRIDVKSIIPVTDPYSYRGTTDSWDEEELQHAFAKASVVELGSFDQSRAFFSSPLGTGVSSIPEPTSTRGEVCTVKVTKAGLLNRKDDILEGGKKASNRKWKPWSVILTGSQLLMFRDPSFAGDLLEQSRNAASQPAIPPATLFRPDELLSVKDSIAVFDATYTKYNNTMRFVMPGGYQILLQAPNEEELNEWISRINYASTFKSAGVRMRPLGMSGQDVKMTGIAAATAHLHDMQLPRLATARLSWDGDSSTRRVEPSLDGGADVPIAPEIEGADQFKATFDQVKADLAAGHLEPSIPPSSYEDSISESDSSPPCTGLSDQSGRSGLPSRSQIIRSKVHDLESKLSVSQTQLDSDLRFIRNIVTLTPFQRSTRERLQLAVQSMAKRIAQVRLDIAKLTCHRDVLSNDLAAEDRNWRRGKKLALRAATETLQSRLDPQVPRMTLSFHAGEELVQRSPPSKVDSRRPSICESFHSALDFTPDWSIPDDLELSSSFLNTSRTLDSPTRSSSGSLGYFQAASDTLSERNPSIDDVSHERFYTAQEDPEELAEDWHRTRCAQRVSLARLPSEMKLSTLFERHAPSQAP